MSTLKKNITPKRLAMLLSTNEKIFHINDLANLWKIDNKNTLRVTLKRYVQDELLHRIYRGFYSVVPINELNPVLIGAKAIHEFCYLTMETVLYQEGFIGQNIDYYTFVSEKSLRFSIGKHNFISRQLKKDFLYNPEGVYLKNDVQIATPERAVCDLLYFNPKYHLDRPIDWEKIKKMQKILGYPLTPKRYVTAKTN
ncbi:MAG: hypothetical protein V1679_03210 [Candidatus Peregrinibacteria bacterium]